MDVYQRRRLVALSAVAAVFVVLVLLIRSCGGDEEEPTPLTTAAGASGLTGATALSQQDFADQGDSICLEANTALASIDSTDEQAATDQAEILTGELSSLQSLTLAPGEKGEKKLQNFIAALQKQVQAYDERALAVERGDDGAVAEIDATIAEQAADAERAAKRFGFEACGDASQVSDTSSGETEGEGEDTATTPVAPAETTAVAPATTTPVTPPAETDTGATPITPPADDGGEASGSGGLAP